MHCTYCGNYLTEKSSFCTNCGAALGYATEKKQIDFPSVTLVVLKFALLSLLIPYSFASRLMPSWVWEINTNPTRQIIFISICTILLLFPFIIGIFLRRINKSSFFTIIGLVFLLISFALETSNYAPYLFQAGQRYQPTSELLTILTYIFNILTFIFLLASFQLSVKLTTITGVIGISLFSILDKFISSGADAFAQTIQDGGLWRRYYFLFQVLFGIVLAIFVFFLDRYNHKNNKNQQPSDVKLPMSQQILVIGTLILLANILGQIIW